MKTIIVNASPRKNWNTAELLKSAQKGAESAGCETEYFDLYSMDFKGCMSCLACKRKGDPGCKCYYRDDLSPLIDKIVKADALIIGSPIYLSEATAGFRALIERLVFCILSYNGTGSQLKKSINTGIIYTMNAPKEYYDKNLRPILGFTEGILAGMLKGEMNVVASCDTLQVKDYSKYDMDMFSEEHKKEVRESQFPADLKAAYELGAKLGRG